MHPHKAGDVGGAAAALVTREAVGGAIIIPGVQTSEKKIHEITTNPVSSTYQYSKEEHP